MSIHPSDEVVSLLNPMTLVVDADARSLSGGMKRRLLVAKALVHSPEMLILDEPTAGVDVDLRKSLWNYIKKINQLGTTICLTKVSNNDVCVAKIIWMAFLISAPIKDMVSVDNFSTANL